MTATTESVVVTGGAGFIGSELVRALLARGAQVAVADRRPHPHCAVRSVSGDLDDPTVIDAAVPPGSTVVVHLAAKTSVLGSLADPHACYLANVAVTTALLERCRRVGVRRFVFASTNAVVGDTGGAVITETSPLHPRTPYGGTKAAAELLLTGYAAGFGIEASTLRFTNVYGPGMRDKENVVPQLLHAAQTGEPVQVYGDGEQRRDFVHVRDAVRALELAVFSGFPPVAVIGSGESVSVNELISLGERVSGRSILREHAPARSGEMREVVVDIALARSHGYRPLVTLEAGLTELWAELCL